MSQYDEPPAGFEGEMALGDPDNEGAPDSVGVLKAKFVRYPGCQQLMIWLPQSGYQGYGALRLTGPGEAVREDTTVRSRLNGSVQILFDTFPWPPGEYRLEITHDDGWRHTLALTKLAEGVAPPAPPPPPPDPDPQPERDAEGEIIYRDGAGRVIPDEARAIRRTVMAKLTTKFSRRLEYEGNFRGGVITYVDDRVRIAFPHEMAGGRMKFYIDTPPAERWEAITGLPLAERDEIVQFVAKQVQREQASSWRFEITATTIDFY